MSKGFGQSAKTFARNLQTRLKRVVARHETPSEALSGLKRDVHKLRHTYSAEHEAGDEKKAHQYLERGRRHYNKKDYSRAAEYFQSAIRYDPHCTWAQTYLGHTLYKQGQKDEAVKQWRKAAQADPDSDAAKKAQAKLDKVGRKVDKTIKKLKGNR